VSESIVKQASVDAVNHLRVAAAQERRDTIFMVYGRCHEFGVLVAVAAI
jgi:hypothetical protein